MAGRWDLGLPKTGNNNTASSIREQAARTLVRNVRSQGHTYVELREDGNKFIFFCTLCLSPCYSDNVLFDHLKGNIHNQRLAAAKVTLFRPNPWPFNDGLVFFTSSTYHTDDDKGVVETTYEENKCRFLCSSHDDNGNNLAIVKYGENVETVTGVDGVECNDETGSRSDIEDSTAIRVNSSLVIPGVVVRDEITDLEVKEVGLGEIAARIVGKDGFGRIWCEWLGLKSMDNEDSQNVSEHDFAIVTFSYNINLGRKGLMDDVKLLLSSSPTIESANGEATSCKRKKSFSDPEDISDSLSNHYESYDDQLLSTRFILNKSIRRELRRQHRLASGRMCDICQQKMLPGKDVATLVNRKTGKLACSSRNVNGAFHVFHTSCLVHWILLCEVEMTSNQNSGLKVKRRSRRKTTAKCNGKDAQLKSVSLQFDSVFCPECQGTGAVVDKDDLEKPKLPLSQMFKYKIKVSDARRAWMESPEKLQNCSTGFVFPSMNEAREQEKVKTLKMLHFYRANE